MKESGKTMEKNSSSYGFEKFLGSDGNYYFRFNDKLGEVVLFSKGYATDQSREKGIHEVIIASSSPTNYELVKVNNGEFLFYLKSADQSKLGRSPLFFSKGEAESKIKTLLYLEENVPIFQRRLDKYSLNKVSLLKTNQGIDDFQPESKLSDNELVEQSNKKMPRYKYSLIYYPDSKIWTIKHDFTGRAINLRKLDGRTIEKFLYTDLRNTEPNAVFGILNEPESSPNSTNPISPKIEPELKETIKIKDNIEKVAQSIAHIPEDSNPINASLRGTNNPYYSLSVKITFKFLDEHTNVVSEFSVKKSSPSKIRIDLSSLNSSTNTESEALINIYYSSLLSKRKDLLVRGSFRMNPKKQIYVPLNLDQVPYGKYKFEIIGTVKLENNQEKGLNLIGIKMIQIC